MMGKSSKDGRQIEQARRKRPNKAKLERLRPEAGEGGPVEEALRAANEQLRASETKLRLSEARLKVRNEIAEIFLTLTGGEMFGEVLRVILAAMKSKYGVFGYIDENGTLVCPSMTTDVWEKCEIANKNIVFPPDKWGDSLWGRAIREKRSLYSNRPAKVPAGHIAILRNLAVPVIYEDNVVGLIHVANKATDYDADDVELLEDIAGHIIAPVLHTRLERDIQEKKRRRAENELASEKKLLRVVIDNIPDRIYVKDRDSRFILYNAAVAEFWQLASPDELIGKTDFDLYDSELASRYYAEEQQVMQTGQPVLNRPSPGTDNRGNLKWCLTTRIPLRDNGKITGIVGISRDITEQKAAQDALEAERNLLRTVIDNLPDEIYVKNTESKFVLYNKTVAEHQGVATTAELIGKSDFDLYPRDIAEQYYADEQQIMRSGEARANYLYAGTNKKDGKELLGRNTKMPLRDGEGAIVGLVGIGQNVTEQKKAHDALRAERDRAQKYLDIAGVIFVALDTNGRVTLINKKGCEVLGYEQADIVGRNWFDNFLSETDRAKLKNIFARLMSGDVEPVEYFENPVLTKTGKERLIAWHNTLLRNEAGEIAGALSSGEDITERRTAQKKLLEYHSRLKRLASQLALAEERQRRRIAGELHDTVSQSLALSKIKVDSLRAGATAKEPDEVLAEVSASLDKAIQNTRSLTFDLSYPILYEVGFEAAVEEWLEENVGCRYGIKTDFYDDGSEKLLDDNVRVLLFRNVRELLTNVIKHSNAKKVTVSVRKIDDEIQVAVKDDGVGFDVERQAATAGRRDEYGLMSIRERLEDVGGKFEIDSSPGGGCTVTMTVPVNIPFRVVNSHG